jgi:Holliday junction resolvase-like predicted endonuclease
MRCRFDVVSVTVNGAVITAIDHIRAAFDASDLA